MTIPTKFTGILTIMQDHRGDALLLSFLGLFNRDLPCPTHHLDTVVSAPLESVTS